MKKTITSHHYSENLVLVVIVEALERLFSVLGSFVCFVATDPKTGPISSNKSGGDAKGVKDAESNTGRK